MWRVSDLRVVHVINKMSPSGGAEVSLAQLVPLLAERGVAQALVTLLPSTASDVLDEFRELGVRHYEAGGPGTARAVAGLRHAVGEFRPDLVSATLYEANRAARLAGALTRTPVLTAVVNTPYDVQARLASPSRWKLAAVARSEKLLASRLTSHFHALTDAAADSAVYQLGVRRADITVVPRGRDRARLGHRSESRRRAVRTALGLADGDLVVLNVGRQERQKGQALLVEAFELLAAGCAARAVLLVAGRAGAATGELERRIAVSPVADRIRLLGLRTDVADLLCAADIFAFSSLWEGLGGAVLEAMAMEAPVVCFDVPAVAEALGGCGVTAPVGDACALGDALLRISGDTGLQRALAAGGRERFDRCYDLDAVVPQMQQLFTTAAQLSAPTGRRR